MGRIQKIYPGNDGLVRVVDVLSNGKVYKRAIGKITLLPVKDEKKEHSATCGKENNALTINNNDSEMFKMKEKKHYNCAKSVGSKIYNTFNMLQWFWLSLFSV